MSGDIGIEEQVIIVPSQTREMTDALAGSALKEGARIIHRYGPRVMIGEVPEHRTEQVRAALRTAEVTAAPHELSARATEGLDPTGALGLSAFSLRQSPEYIAAKERRPYQNAQWDMGGQPLPPDPPPHLEQLTRSPEMARGMEAFAVSGTTSQQMTGRIAVGIIIVSGPTADLQFSPRETQKVVAEVQNGLGWHASHPAANITWFYDIHSVQVNVPPGGGGDQEALWRDPAMVQLGYQGNWQGVFDYINHIKTQYGTQWTYVGYFTKYPIAWFAYASIGGPRLVMQYANDGWGPDNIDRVFAHETGHIFQAPDEYSASNCNCGGSWGIYDKPNGNCQLCAPGGGVDCIMRSNSWAYCAWTPLHYGFPQLGLTSALGAITVDNRRPYVFVKGSDDNMWVNWWSGTAWNWANQGRPSGINIAGAIGAITLDGGRPYAFIKEATATCG
jgi:hypothetical protein